MSTLLLLNILLKESHLSAATILDKYADDHFTVTAEDVQHQVKQSSVNLTAIIVTAKWVT